MIPNTDIFYSFNDKDYIEVKEHYKKVRELEQEIERLKQQIDDIKSFCKSFDLNKISDKEKVILDSIILIANGTIKVVK